ncbi:hypothetical protein [Gulosibacter sediminis]|uniref:hypothetical protein n=1 Tax=Gulosibacter sediminis TaxID=1729695 RepID=UPI0024A7C3C0|nr:hypothetical protein [Gulosibacter sediminis]
MSNTTGIDEELEQRLTRLEGEEQADAAHAPLSAAALGSFLLVAIGIAVVSWAVVLV